MLEDKGHPDLIWTPYPRGNHPSLFDIRGHRRSASLFGETTQDSNRDPVFSLRDYDNGGRPSAYILYMDSIDEYDAAVKMVGCMSHWRKLLNLSWFMNGDITIGFMGLLQWRLDMMARDSSVARKVLMKKVADGDRQAAQFMLTYTTKGAQAGVSKDKKIPKTKLASVPPLENGESNILDLVRKLSPSEE